MTVLGVVVSWLRPPEDEGSSLRVRGLNVEAE